MKQKISICVDEELISRMEQEVAKGLFRSRSHLIEYIMQSSMNRPENLPQPRGEHDGK